MRRAGPLGITILGSALLAAACGERAPSPDRMSVVLVTLDTTRADRVGAFGGTAVPTPHLDAAARDGVVFEEAISQVPLTLPAHATILTSRYPATHGVRHNGIYRLPDDEVTLAENLRDAGFETAAFVGAYVLNRGFGTEQGFETYDDVPVNRFSGGHDQLFEAQRTADEVNARVFEWLDRHHEGRFFLWVHYYDPHDPYDPPEKEGRTLTGEGYDREISYLDSCFGDLLERLRSHGVLDRSVLAVIGDHGESLGEHGEKTHGIFLYEGALHVPFFLRAPGLVPRGTRVAGPVELVDLAPTVLALLGLPPLANAQGRSLLPRIRGEDDGALAIAHAETLMPRLEFGWSELRMVRDSRFKFVEAPVPELYDLRDDPGEKVNLAPNDPERAGELAARLARWVAATTDSDAERNAGRTLSPDEEARLKSLGYLGGDAFRGGGDSRASRPDPKAMMDEVRRLDAARDRLAGGDPGGALRDVEAILADNPSNHQARTTRILALIDLHRMDEALDEAFAALAAAETDPDASPVLIEKARGMLASLHVLRGEAGEAETLYRRILEDDPANETIRVDLARLLIESGRLGQAAEIVAAVLEDDPRNGMALAARYLLEERGGEADAALRTAEALADARAGDPPTLIRAGERLLAAGQAARAAACFEVAQDQLPLDGSLLMRLGNARLRAGDRGGARQAFLAASRLRPADPWPFHWLGAIALEEGDEKGARSWFDRALGIDPRFTPPLVGFGRWLASRGRQEEAREVLADAVSRNPSDSAARKALEELGTGP